MNKWYFLIVISIIIFSCSKEELKYSCNPEINAIVKSGEKEFSQISLSKFLQYDIELQRAIFRSLSKDKRKSFWLEKMDSLLINPRYNDQELVHLEKLALHIKSSYFLNEEADSTMFKQEEDFERNWTDFARKSLKWEEPEIYFITNSLCTNKSQYEQIRLELKEISLSLLSSSCNCSSESNNCAGIGGSDCNINGCIQLSGCGFLWLYTCDGTCLL